LSVDNPEELRVAVLVVPEILAPARIDNPDAVIVFKALLF
tara:strand:+ start:403 stop:522 length:120 start_codon:yes stop_codon:yes gene_type:complete